MHGVGFRENYQFESMLNVSHQTNVVQLESENDDVKPLWQRRDTDWVWKGTDELRENQHTYHQSSVMVGGAGRGLGMGMGGWGHSVGNFSHKL